LFVTTSNRFENAALEATCSKTLNNKLDNLMREFAFVCRLYAEVICVERDLPVSQKTVKPAELGGVAGEEAISALSFFLLLISVSLSRW
jgi:hypothetical protein